MKLNLPISLRQSLLACLALAVGYTMCGGSTAIASDYVLDAESTLSIDYADAETILDLSGGSLQLMGNTELLLFGCGAGDGRVYTLATGVSELRDAEGNPIVLTPSNNAASQYFDTTQPGTGFWADATLQLTTDGTLQLVRHNETVKDAVTITTRQAGGADYQYYEGVSFKDINSTSAYGGAIFGESNSTITLSNNGSVTFSGNTASSSSSSSHSAYAYGGAIYGRDSTITLNNNGSVTFSGNTASSSSSSAYAAAYAYGGAIFGESNSTITLSNNGSVTFSENTASSSSSSAYYSSNAYGGAIYGRDSTITLNNNGSVTFSGNTASFSSSSSSSSRGGAIYGGSSSTITLSNNGSVTFSGNTASSSYEADGGAIYGHSSTITLSDNESVTFSGNTASSSYAAYGGAIYGWGSTITLSDNESVTFSENTASSSHAASGGAIYGWGSTITLSNNGSVTFSGNTASSSYAASGGAIYGNVNSTITLSNNGSVVFNGNTASSSSSSYGGAICSNGIVTITGNDEVTFAQNVEKSGSTYRLRSLYMAGDSSSGKLTLSAGEKQSIRFYDSVYMGAKGSVALNADYTDAEGATQKATGTILFSGATTEDDLKDAKNGVAGTEEEILNSRTSELNSAATLYGGTLQVQDKAVLKLNGGLTVAEGSEASVEIRAAELNLGSHALSMVSGSSLALADGAKVTATEVTITTGATLAVGGSVSTAPLTEQVAALTLSKETVAGFDASLAVNMGSVSVLDGDLTLESGSLLSLDDAYLELSGNLFFDVAEGEEKIALDIAPGVITDENNQVVLFNVDGVVTFGFDGLTASADNGMVYCVKAEDYFTGSRVQESTKLVYDSKSGVVYLEDVTEGTVPEPTSSMLSLLGLVAFTLRRRRK